MDTLLTLGTAFIAGIFFYYMDLNKGRRWNTRWYDLTHQHKSPSLLEKGLIHLQPFQQKLVMAIVIAGLFTAVAIAVGGAGNDRLEGQWGNDSYFWGAGQGSDAVIDYWTEGAGSNTLVLSGLNPQDVELIAPVDADYTTFVIRIKASGETLTVNTGYQAEYRQTVQAPTTDQEYLFL